MTDSTPKTDIEKCFVKNVEILDSLGVDYFIHGGTLLGWYRNKRLPQREGNVWDKEINFGMLAQDYTREFHDKLKAASNYFETHSSPSVGEFPPTLTFFGTHTKPDKKPQWDMPAFSLLTLFWLGNTRVVHYLGRDYAYSWDREHLADKSKWTTITYYGKQVKAPYKIQEYLIRYFGDDYMTDIPGWHFRKNAHNNKSWKKLQEDGELDIKNYFKHYGS
jgi:hypothetical protein